MMKLTLQTWHLKTLISSLLSPTGGNVRDRLMGREQFGQSGESGMGVASVPVVGTNA
ncbi:MAG: hypothetical protein WDN48_19125 [Pseudolabrys sp.]